MLRQNAQPTKGTPSLGLAQTSLAEAWGSGWWALTDVTCSTPQKEGVSLFDVQAFEDILVGEQMGKNAGDPSKIVLEVSDKPTKAKCLGFNH